MSLTNTYRAKLVAKQNRQFWAYLGLAIVIHGVGAAGLIWGNPQQWLNFLNAEAPKPQITPIDFVYVEADDQTTPSPSPTNRRAQTNATAASNQSTAPVQPGKSTAPHLNIAESASASPTSPPLAPLPTAPPAIQPEPPQPTPLPSPIRAPLSRVSEPSPIPTAVPTVPPISASPTRLVSPTRPSTSSPLPSPVPSSANPARPSAAAPLGGPIARSLTIGDNGLRGQANADRLGSGTSVDARRDDQWGTYLSALNQLVDQNWQRVSVEATRRTKIQFRVDRQGRLTDLQLIQSSGDTLADQAALQAVRAAAPFAPLPQDTTEDVLIVNFTFTQWLQSDPP